MKNNSIFFLKNVDLDRIRSMNYQRRFLWNEQWHWFDQKKMKMSPIFRSDTIHFLFLSIFSSPSLNEETFFQIILREISSLHLLSFINEDQHILYSLQFASFSEKTILFSLQRFSWIFRKNIPEEKRWWWIFLLSSCYLKRKKNLFILIKKNKWTLFSLCVCVCQWILLRYSYPVFVSFDHHLKKKKKKNIEKFYSEEYSTRQRKGWKKRKRKRKGRRCFIVSSIFFNDEENSFVICIDEEDEEDDDWEEYHWIELFDWH